MGDRTFATFIVPIQHFAEEAERNRLIDLLSPDEIDDFEKEGYIYLSGYEYNYGGENEKCEFLSTFPDCPLIVSWHAGGDYGPGSQIVIPELEIDVEVEQDFNGAPVLLIEGVEHGAVQLCPDSLCRAKTYLYADKLFCAYCKSLKSYYALLQEVRPYLNLPPESGE